jgi:hypothetical protein
VRLAPGTTCSRKRRERRLELHLQAARVRAETGRPLVRLEDDAARLCVRLDEDRVGLALRLLPQLAGGALRRDEAGVQERLEVAVAGELALEVLELVGEVGAVAPDGLEALRDLSERPLDRRRLEAERPSREGDVPDLDRAEGHGTAPS